MDDAARAMGARRVSVAAEASWSGAAIDSRRIGGGELFFALAGEHTDGHRFVADAVARGAAAAVVERDRPMADLAADAPRLEVDSVYDALHALTVDVRRRLPERLVGVTGSAGKTTTKELLAAMLESRFRVARTPGNFNNLLGFPLSLLGIPEGTEWMVAEMGMSVPGELGRISRLGRPDVAVFTCIRRAHMESFADLAAVADAKAELLEGLADDGVVIANADDPHVVSIARRHGGSCVWYGVEQPADHRAEEIFATPGGGSRFVWRSGDRRQEVELALFGRHNVENFLAAAACAASLGVDEEAIAAAAATVEPPSMRGVVHRLPGGTTIVDDSYNANPDAVTAALAAAAELPSARRWAVLGDMLELGEESAAYHRETGRRAAEMGFSPILGVGVEAQELIRAAAEAGAETQWVETVAEASRRAVAELRIGDLVLVKGSRGVGLDLLVESLLTAGGES